MILDAKAQITEIGPSNMIYFHRPTKTSLLQVLSSPFPISQEEELCLLES